MGIGFLNHHVMKGSKMDLDQDLFPSTASFLELLSVSIDNTMSSNIDIGAMINDNCHHLRGEGWGGGIHQRAHDRHVGLACNDCNSSSICMYHELKSSE